MNFYRAPRVGRSVLGDVLSPFSDAADAVKSVALNVPGADWVEGAFNSGVLILGDMARSPKGKLIITAISEAGFGALVPFVGPQIASLMWGLPDTLAGEDYVKAYTREVLRRGEAVVMFFAGKAASDAGKDVGKDVAKGIGFDVNKIANDPTVKEAFKIGYTELKRQGLSPEDAAKKLGFTPEQIAARFNVRPDVAALAINWLAGETVYPMSRFDVATGARSVALGPEDRSTGANSTWALVDVLQAQKDGAPADVVQALTNDYQASLRIENESALGRADASEILTEVLRAQQRGASTEYVKMLEKKLEIAMGKPIRQIDVTSIRRRKDELASQAERERIFAKGGVFIEHAAPTSGLFAQVLTFAVLTVPAWGAWLWLKRRNA